MNLLKEANMVKLKDEQARLKAGNVGIGFDKIYLQQALGMVTGEIKLREKLTRKQADEPVA